MLRKWTCKEDFATNLLGITVALIGITGLIESQLQIQLIGEQLPLIKGTMLSLFTVSFGLVLTTEDASKALQKITKKL